VPFGYPTIRNLQGTHDVVVPVAPTEVWPLVLHGGSLALAMPAAAITGFGRACEAADGSETRTPPAE